MHVPLYNGLCAKIASITTAITSLFVLAFSFLLSPNGLLPAILLVLFVGVATYATCYVLIARRLELASTTLMQIREHDFEHLEAAHVPAGDELNTLIWQTYRTGLALQKELREMKKTENYRREFLGNVSHELKTPIFAIQGFAETLLDGALEDEGVRRQFVEKILSNATRLNNLARDLSDISRIETGELKMTVEPFSLHRLIGEAVESLELTARDREITLSTHVPDGLPLVLGDRERIRQVLVNLVDNGIKYSNPGGLVEISAEALPDGDVRVTVRDEGIGIAPEDLPRITERFYRVDKSRSRNQGGTGLGLAIIKHILNAHDRKLEIDSTLGRGSTFSFTLPKADTRQSSFRNAISENGWIGSVVNPAGSVSSRSPRV